MRQVRNRLHDAFEHPVLCLVEDEREQNGQREAEDEVIQADEQRIAQQPSKVNGTEKFLEPLQADPRRLHHAGAALVILKGDDDPVHGGVMKQEVVDDAGKREQQQVFALPALAP